MQSRSSSVLLLALPGAAHAAESGLTRAAAALAQAQRSFPDAAASWAWSAKSAQAAPNAAGLVALGLVRGYGRTGDASALAAARRWGEARLADLAAWRPLYDPDVEALAALGRATGDANYTEAARTAFDRRWGGATGDEALARLKMIRGANLGYVGYDAALAIRAARAVGHGAFAAALARAVVSAPGLVPAITDPRGIGVTARAALVGAVTGLDDPAVVAAAGRWAEALVAAQGRDGSWSFHNTQATAYAVAALATRTPAAAAKGRAWLTKTQRPDGTWTTFDDGMPAAFSGPVVHEVSAEALLALADTQP